MLATMIHAIARYVTLSVRLHLKGEAPVIVYSKERTGSVALYNSLVAAGVPAIATHYLDPAKIGAGRLSGSAQWASKHVVQPRRRAKFITLVRNPVDNLLSTFARSEFVDKPRALAMSPNAALDVAADELAARFRRYMDDGELRRELEWFDAEFRVALGIDVFDFPFDATLGFSRISSSPFDALILRTELSDGDKANAVAQFLNLPTFAMAHGPVTVSDAPGVAGEQADYREQYRELKRRVVIPRPHWDAIVSSKVARHFITDGELARSREQVEVVDEPATKSPASYAT